MTQLDQIRLINDATILYLQKMKINCERNILIKNILKDDACFFKLDKKDAYTILEDTGIDPLKIDLAYSDLTSIDNYYFLKQSGKLQDYDPEIKIKYNDYNSDDLFNKYTITKNVHEYNNASDESQNTSIINQKENFFKTIINKIINWFK